MVIEFKSCFMQSIKNLFKFMQFTCLAFNVFIDKSSIYKTP